MSDMTEEQIMDAFAKDVPVNSSEPPAEAKQPEEASQEPQVEGQEPEETQAAPEEPEEATIEIDPDEPLFEQELTDKEGRKKKEKLSLKELQRGYLAQAETTRRFQEAARIRTEAQEAVRKAEQQATEQSVKRLSELQDFILQAAAPELKNVNWDKLASEDAFEYVRLSNRAKQINDALQVIRAEKAKLEEAQKSEKQKARLERLAKSDETLRSEGFSDETMSRFIKQAEDSGFTKEELQDFDHRFFRLAHKAALYDDLQAKQAGEKKIVEKKVSVVPKVLKPGPKPKPTTAADEAMQKVKKTGKMTDALPIFEAWAR